MAESTPIAAGAMPEGDYAIVEALGHRTLIGRVSEIERFGTKLLQVEPLFGDVMLGPILLGGGSIYQFTPCSADVAFARRPKSPCAFSRASRCWVRWILATCRYRINGGVAIAFNLHRLSMC